MCIVFILVLMWWCMSFLRLCLHCQSVFFTTTSWYTSPKYESTMLSAFSLSSRSQIFFSIIIIITCIIQNLFKLFHEVRIYWQRERKKNQHFWLLSNSTCLISHIFSVVIKLQCHKLHQFSHELEENTNLFLLYYECVLCCSGMQNVDIWLLQIHKQNWLKLRRY